MAYVTNEEFLPYMEAAIEAFSKKVPIGMYIGIRGWEADKK